MIISIEITLQGKIARSQLIGLMPGNKKMVSINDLREVFIQLGEELNCKKH